MKSNVVAALGMIALATVAPLPIAAAQTGPALNRGWEHTVIGPAVNCGRGMSRIFQAGPGLVLFDGCDTEVLTSADGVSWHPLALPPLQIDNVSNWGFFAAGSLFFLYGSVYSQGPGPVRLAVWASLDVGKTWKRSTSDLQIGSLTSGGDGLLATAFAPGSFNSSLWTSTDGLTWKRLPDPAGVFASADVRLVVHSGSGWIAGGTLSPASSPSSTAIWTSPDGRTWTRSGGLGLPQGTSITSIVSGPKGTLAILSAQNGPAVAMSTDGQHWQSAKNSPPGNFYYYFGATSVAAWQGGFIWLADEGGEAALWSSADGLKWTRVGGDELFGGTVQVGDIVSFNGGVVAVGGFATHPQPACFKTHEYVQNDLRSYQTAVLRWNPTASTDSSPSTVDRSDPQLSKLLPSDLGRNLSSSDLQSYQTAFVNLCADRGALGKHRAYRVSIPLVPVAPGTPPNLPGQELTIVAQSAAAAHSAFSHAAAWMFAGAAPHSDRVSTRIGNETEAFSFPLPTDYLPAGSHAKGHAVIWRQGRALGEIYTTNLSLSTTLAQKQYSRMQNPPAATR